MELTPQQIAAACGCTQLRAANWAESLNEAMSAWDINTPARAAAFLAQIAHESGRLVYVREIWQAPNGTPAQARYEGRTDLGNNQKGDGFRYRGRGLIQITGRANYAAARDGVSRVMETPDFEEHPELLEAPRWAAQSAACFWFQHDLNELADAGQFERITRRINGGTNGLSDRLALWKAAKAALET